MGLLIQPQILLWILPEWPIFTKISAATSTVHFMVESWSNQEVNHHGLPHSTIRARLYQRLSLTLQREFAQMIMKRMSTQDSSWLL